jgi:hypothetical protein
LVSFLICLDARGQRRRLHETHSWNSEPQNIEYRTAECRRPESLRSVIFL